MRMAIGIAAIGVIWASSAIAQVTHEEAFNLCISQPLLQTDSLVPMIDHILSKPHEPQLDLMSKGQILDKIQFTGGNKCAAAFEAHPDAFAIVAGQKLVSNFALGIAWDAVNVTCRDRLSGTCVQKEVDAAVAITESHKRAGGQTPAQRACSLILKHQVGFVELKQCMDAVGGQNPDKSILFDCVFSLDLHSQVIGGLAGRKISACFKKGG